MRDAVHFSDPFDRQAVDDVQPIDHPFVIGEGEQRLADRALELLAQVTLDERKLGIRGDLRDLGSEAVGGAILGGLVPEVHERDALGRDAEPSGQRPGARSCRPCSRQRGRGVEQAHRYDEARAAAERALEIWRRAGSSPFYQATALTFAGEALLGSRRPDDAVARLEKACQLFGDDQAAYPQEARFALARALWTRSDAHPRALALAREAKAGYDKLSNAKTEAAEVDAWLRARDEVPSGRRR